ncbi:MAG: hypothetical protein HRT88_23615, partial [Lentisphaeraceae bacterium]|nr:hypothetical protein [Lentisphaeraceae bacterium]
MKLPWKHIHFIGIGGAGMSALASLVLQRGVQVSGSDLEIGSVAQRLQSKGAVIVKGHDHAIPGNPDLVVYSAAVKEENPERQNAVERSLAHMKRGAFLAELADCYPKVISVGGSHGKTTVTSMLAHIFKECGAAADFVIGGSPAGKLLSAEIGQGEYFITEADESDCSLALLTSHIGVVINAEDDHAWSAGGREQLFQAFKTFAGQSTTLVYGQGEIPDELFSDNENGISLNPHEDEEYVPQAGQ